MRIVVALLTFAASSLAQNTPGALYRGLSSPSGDYTLTKLPAGKYELSVSMPCCSYQPFTQADFYVPPARTLRFDVHLAEGASYNTLGDDPNTLAEALRSRAAVPSAPAPRMPNGKPDLSGVWQGNDDLYPENPEVLPWTGALVKERLAHRHRPVPLQAGADLHAHRRGWIGLDPITGELHLTERYHRRDLAHLDIVMTVDDPGTARKPWKMNMTWDLVPKEDY